MEPGFDNAQHFIIGSRQLIIYGKKNILLCVSMVSQLYLTITLCENPLQAFSRTLTLATNTRDQTLSV